MNKETAVKIAEYVWNHRQPAVATNVLCRETGMDRVYAQGYLLRSGSRETLIKKLTDDFVVSDEDILKGLEEEARDLQQRINSMRTKVYGTDSTKFAVKPTWWVISEDQIMKAFQRIAAGEDPQIVYAELYTNSGHDRVEGNDAD